MKLIEYAILSKLIYNFVILMCFVWICLLDMDSPKRKGVFEVYIDSLGPDQPSRQHSMIKGLQRSFTTSLDLLEYKFI